MDNKWNNFYRVDIASAAFAGATGKLDRPSHTLTRWEKCKCQPETLHCSGVSNEQRSLKEAAQGRRRPKRGGCRWQERTAPPSRATRETHGAEKQAERRRRRQSVKHALWKVSETQTVVLQLPAPLRVNQWDWRRYVGPLAEIREGLTADTVSAEFHEGRPGGEVLKGEFLRGARLMALYRRKSAHLTSPWPFSVNAVC